MIYPNPRENVLLILLDCARADHFSCYGYRFPTTPNIDRLAAQGVRFSHMITTAPWTLPSHASLFTGLYPSSHGATDEHRRLEPHIPTLAEMLRDAGYATAGFCANPWIVETGLARGFEFFFDHRPRFKKLTRQYFFSQKLIDAALGRRDSGGRRSVRAFARWLSEVPQEKPFFAFVHLNEPHLKYHPPRPYDRLFLNGVPRSRVKSVNQDCNKYIAGYVEMGAEDFKILTALYDGEIRYADSLVGKIERILESAGRLKRTLFVITADHGENLGDHGLMSHKFVLYDTLLRVPLIMSCPGLVPVGVVSDALAQTVDILPTLGSLLRIEPPPVEGMALADRGGLVAPDRTFTVSEKFRPNLRVFRERYPLFDCRVHDVRRRALRTRTHKYIWQSDGQEFLFDLQNDPGENRDIAAENPELVADLREKLGGWLAARRSPEGALSREPDFDPLVKRQLAELGYIED